MENLKNKSFLKRILLSTRNILSIVGVATILGIILNVDSIQIWLAQPRLKVEVLNWYGIRDTSSVSNDVPVFDEFEVKLNIIPRVRFHPSHFPINQVKGISITKGEWFGAYRTDREIPFNIKDEPVILKIIVYRIPIEGVNSGKNVEIKVFDMRGNVSTASITKAF